MLTAQEAFFLPTSFNIDEAITRVHPLCSSTNPNVVPKTMINPSERMMFRNHPS